MKRNTLIILLLVIGSCRDRIPFDASMAGSSLAPYTSSTNDNEIDQSMEEDCLFTQNLHVEISDEYGHLGEVRWIEDEQIAQITLPNKDLLKVKKGGCDYASYDIYWSLNQENQSIEDVNYWLNKTKWLMAQLFESSDQKTFLNNINEKNYHFKTTDSSLYLTFTNHQYEEWYLKVSKNDQHVVLATGYYYN